MATMIKMWLSPTLSKHSVGQIWHPDLCDFSVQSQVVVMVYYVDVCMFKLAYDQVNKIKNFSTSPTYPSVKK